LVTRVVELMEMHILKIASPISLLPVFKSAGKRWPHRNINLAGRLVPHPVNVDVFGKSVLLQGRFAKRPPVCLCLNDC
jgi:hypothetical protein